MLARILIGVVRLYQLTVSPWMPGACRYTPTCSRYAIGAIEGHGALRGSWLAVKRLARCHPWGGCGYDPVPPTRPLGPDRRRVDAPEPQAARSGADDVPVPGSDARPPRLVGADVHRTDEDDRGDRRDGTARTDRVMAG